MESLRAFFLVVMPGRESLSSRALRLQRQLSEHALMQPGLLHAESGRICHGIASGTKMRIILLSLALSGCASTVYVNTRQEAEALCKIAVGPVYPVKKSKYIIGCYDASSKTEYRMRSIK